MKITARDFISIYLVILDENEINYIKLNDFIETVKIIYTSSEYQNLVKKLELDGLKEDDFYEHPYVKNISNDGVLKFEVDEKDAEEIFTKYDEESNLVTKAINKLAAAKYMEQVTQGKITMAYEDSDGDYTLPMVDEIFNFCESKLFTDGNLQIGEVHPDTQLYSSHRELVVTDSTYSIIVDYQNKKPLAAVVRAYSTMDYVMLLNEAKKLISGDKSSYKTETDDKPKVYKFKIH